MKVGASVVLGFGMMGVAVACGSEPPHAALMINKRKLTMISGLTVVDLIISLLTTSLFFNTPTSEVLAAPMKVYHNSLVKKLLQYLLGRSEG